jgi:3-hydroxybutyryl-CoA dehydratase
LVMEESEPLKKIVEGNKFKRSLKISPDLVDSFAKLSGDYNPMHLNEEYAKSKGFPGRISHGNILGMLISTLVGEELPAKGVMIVSEKINFKKPVQLADEIDLFAKVVHLSEATRIVELQLEFKNSQDIKVASGSCQVKIL